MLLYLLIWAFSGTGWAAGAPSGFPFPVPDPEAFKGWQRQSGEDSLFGPGGSRKIPPVCARPGIFPTHPQMSLKHYHLVLTGTYDHFRLSGGDAACAMGGKKPNGKGVVPCLRPDTLVYVLLSDSYQDFCGNQFRGVKEISFFRRHEKMSTLFSPGRTVERKPDSPFEEYILAPTQMASAEEFDFFLELFPEDGQKIGRERERAIKAGLIFNEQSGLFERK